MFYCFPSPWCFVVTQENTFSRLKWKLGKGFDSPVKVDAAFLGSYLGKK